MSATGILPVNHWPDSSCARAFWGQRELPPYRRLLSDTVAWLEPRSGQRWLDLGCGGGQLTRALWEKSRGSLAGIVALDCAAANARAIRRLRSDADPPAGASRIRFLHADFSGGLAQCRDGRFDGVVSGLAVQYAESYCPARGWNSDAYDHLLAEVHRVLRPGGCFVFSVNVPEPSWGRIGFAALPFVFGSPRPIKLLKNILRMWRYGGWLKREARRGRFHYLPIGDIIDRLEAAGFEAISHRLSFCKQAYVVRCRKP